MIIVGIIITASDLGLDSLRNHAIGCYLASSGATRSSNAVSAVPTTLCMS